MPHVENIAKTTDIHSGRAATMQPGSLPSARRHEGALASPKAAIVVRWIVSWDWFVQQASHDETRQDGPLGRDGTG